jgi:XTP/dITP diphosphohydrolase
MKLYFVTMNESKIAESVAYFSQSPVAAARNLELCILRHNVEEIMDPRLEAIVKRKALSAYQYLRQPCLVEHSGLFFESLPDLPGPLGKIIWNAVGDRMCGFLNAQDSRIAIARAIVGYCDGRRIRLFMGETRGAVADRARGEYNKSNWDPIFIPEGSTETYGEMGPARKRLTSPLAKAWDQFMAQEFPSDTPSTSRARRQRDQSSSAKRRNDEGE